LRTRPSSGTSAGSTLCQPFSATPRLPASMEGRGCSVRSGPGSSQDHRFGVGGDKSCRSRHQNGDLGGHSDGEQWEWMAPSPPGDPRASRAELPLDEVSSGGTERCSIRPSLMTPSLTWPLLADAPGVTADDGAAPAGAEGPERRKNASSIDTTYSPHM